MKYFIALSAVVFAACALPTEFGKEVHRLPPEHGLPNVAVFNSTARNIPYGQAGFATLNGGTFGGAGGAVWTVWDPWALRDAVSGDAARIIYVRGRIDLTSLFTGSPGVILVVGKFKSIYGGDQNAMIYGGGLKTYESWQLIVHNIKFHNVLSYAPGEQPNGAGGIVSMVPGAWSQVDAIDIEDTIHVWVDHCEFADDPWIAASTPDNQRRHDGLIDIKRGSNFISISNNIFRNHNLAMLVGHSDDNGPEDIGRLKITYYLNWYQGTVQRNPMVRFGEVHVLNNLYTDIRDYGIGIWTGALVYGERNVFLNTRRSWGLSVIAGNPNPRGFFLNVDNWLVNSSHDSGIPSDGIRWNPSQYYGYSAMAPSNVEWHVRTYSGTY